MNETKRPKSFRKKLIELHACADALDWVGRKSLPRAWADCENPGWMFWLAGRGGLPRQQIVLAACEIARTVLHLVQPGEIRPLLAIEAAEGWARGEVDNAAAADAAAAVDQAADAADAAAAAAYAADAVYVAAAATAAAVYVAAAATYAADAAAAAAYATAAVDHATAAAYAADADADAAVYCEIVKKHNPVAQDEEALK